MSSWRGFTALKWQVGVGFILVWNALTSTAMRLNGDSGQFVDRRAYAVVAVATFGAAAFCALILWSSSFRNLVTSEHRRDRYEPGPHVTVLVAAALLGLSALGFALGWAS